MEAADLASLSDEELVERRISRLGFRLDGTTLDPLIRSSTTNFFGQLQDVMLEVQNKELKPKVGTCQQ
jgi:hypothetical protein